MKVEHIKDGVLLAAICFGVTASMFALMLLVAYYRYT